MRSIVLVMIIVLAFTAPTGTVVWSQTPGEVASQSSGNTFYVSRNGSNEDGLSWKTAWNEFDQIVWENIAPGDTIFIDGGPEQMQYETSLEIGQSGELDNPLTIKVSTEENHNGQVILFGGREALLPYCGQTMYENASEDSLLLYGIRTLDHDHIIIDGSRWYGMKIHGFGTSGLRIDRGSNYITVRYLEITNNGEAFKGEHGWRSDHAGIRLGGSEVTLQRMIVHDNGQDAIQSLSGDNRISSFRLEQSWLYNGRQHPTVDQSANYCTHTDGIQIFDGGLVSGITVTESVIGPGLTQGVILGQTLTESGSQAHVQNAVFRDVLFSKASDSNILAYRDTASRNWTIERVTLHCPNTEWHCLRLFNSDHAVINSIIVGARITLPNGLDEYRGNCTWNTEGFELGQNVNPNFTDVSDTDYFSLDDYSIPSDSPCVGSRITSVHSLFQLE